MRKVNVLVYDEKCFFIDTSLSHVCSTYMDPRINTPDPVDSTYSNFSFLCSNPMLNRRAFLPLQPPKATFLLPFGLSIYRIEKIENNIDLCTISSSYYDNVFKY